MSGRVLLAVRLGERAEAAAVHALRIAEALESELVLVYVAVELETVPQLHAGTGVAEEDLRTTMLEEIEQRLREFAARHLPGRTIRHRVEEGDVAEAVSRVAADEAVDYIVIGTEGRASLLHLIMGGTARDILRRAPCPVLVVPPPHPHP